MSYEYILYEKQGAVAYVTLNRPEKLNALSDDLQAEAVSYTHLTLPTKA